MSHDPNCLFCKIAAGAIPSTKVHEDDEFVAFRDIRPAAETHVLVIPRKHIATLSNCTEGDAPLLGRMLVLAARLADQLGVAYTGGETGFSHGNQYRAGRRARGVSPARTHSRGAAPLAAHGLTRLHGEFWSRTIPRPLFLPHCNDADAIVWSQ
ncbi:scavenger mRNA decapping enzyme DcpS-like protein [Paraburkholderia sp. BL9I2N2]|nr:scavenger mRNA decapping enzyme DcpS-like protein [Paraburkholderia sp. BL9I2N2]